MATDPGLRYHGDAELALGLADLAVNVRRPESPEWLRAELARTRCDLASYPDPSAAGQAVAAGHGRDASEVLRTAGAAEALVRIARALKPRRAVIVHPQFTEPEAALRAAGHPVGRVILRPDNGFRLAGAVIPPEADLLFIGNPTNPTSVLHPAAELLRFATAGRVLVVDEATPPCWHSCAARSRCGRSPPRLSPPPAPVPRPRPSPRRPALRRRLTSIGAT
jgi:histidinol-phosphate aminotransferase